MFFKGTEKRNARAIADDMDAVGGQLNAYTSKEHTCYYTRTLDTHFDVALDILTDMFFNSKFDEAEINKERNVINEEISMYEDTPEDVVHDLLQGKVWPGSPLGYSILGTPESIGGFTHEQMTGYLRAHYRPDNTVVAIAGNFEPDKIMEKITKVFAPFKAPSFEIPAVEVSKPYSPAFITREKDIEQVHLAMGFPGIPSDSDDTYTLAAVNTILGGGMSSRLFQKIREERGLVYTVYSYNAGYSDTGVFTVYAALNPNQLYDVLKLITEEIRRLFTDRVTEDQLSRTKEQLKSNFLLSLENAANRMNSIGRTQLMLNKIITTEELIEKIDAVTLDKFYELSERIFNFEKMSLSLVGKRVEDYDDAGSGVCRYNPLTE
jgi:predicted Zn-dependent peptidase